MSGPRAVVIGAGPVGLAAALGCVQRGLEVTVLEAESVGAFMKRWGPTRLFSPLSMNLPLAAKPLLKSALPDDSALLTGPQFADDVLAPLAESPPLRGRILTQHRVISVARAGMLRGDFPGHPVRAERPFSLLVETPRGEERVEAELVLDASGVYGLPTSLGAKGKRAISAQIIRDLGALDRCRHKFGGRNVLLLGNGHSAANAISVLEEVATHAPSTRVTWAVRNANLRPCTEVASDPLAERSRVVSHANELAIRPPAWLRMERRVWVTSFEKEANGTVNVRFSRNVSLEQVDHVIALVGYRPDLSFLSELALEIDPVTEGAARLSRALSNMTDCLSVPKVAPEDLCSGEPGFNLVGAKSYGRARTFLLQSGYAQLELLLDSYLSPLVEARISRDCPE